MTSLEATGGPAAAGPPVLRLTGASKSFGGVHALRDVDLLVRAGEVHAVLGQNGSGKSTLMKCLSGYYEPEPGWRIEVNGTELDRPLRVGEFRELGMSFVHQDLGLIPSLDVTENLRMLQYAAGDRKNLSFRHERRAAEALLREFEVAIDASVAVATLRPVERALLAIVRAVDELRRWKERAGSSGGVLLLDEATAQLDREGKLRVAGLVRRIAAGGAGVVIVSHDLKEALSVSDSVTVLRDGAVAARFETASLDPHDAVEHLIERMTGQRRDIGAVARARRAEPPGATVVARIEGLSSATIPGFSAEFRHGEVLGISGLVGAGWETVPLLVFGSRRAGSGSLRLGEDEFDLTSANPERSVAAGVVLVPANRQDEGVVGELSVASNVSLPVIGSFMRRGRLLAKTERLHVSRLLDRYAVVPPDGDMRIGSLSGGNQQKAVMAKWLSMGPRLLLLQDPTQGVDVAARERIHDIVWRAARAGHAVLYASADYEELAAVADRVLVMSDGEIVSELSGDEVTEDALAAASLRGQHSAFVAKESV